MKKPEKFAMVILAQVVSQRLSKLSVYIYYTLN
jgi:hypothetical protein